ncbi:MAG: hypothetical protein ACLQNE_02440 [Thermoguttaceae bacterium]
MPTSFAGKWGNATIKPAPRTGRSAAEDLLTVLRHYAKHPAWLTVGGKPVVFVYGRALGEIGLPGWLAAIEYAATRPGCHPRR